MYELGWPIYPARIIAKTVEDVGKEVYLDLVWDEGGPRKEG